MSVSSTSSRACSITATWAASASLSPNVISSVAVESFSFTTGTTPQDISRRKARRAFTYEARRWMSASVRSTWPVRTSRPPNARSQCSWSSVCPSAEAAWRSPSPRGRMVFPSSPMPSATAPELTTTTGVPAETSSAHSPATRAKTGRRGLPASSTSVLDPILTTTMRRRPGRRSATRHRRSRPSQLRVQQLERLPRGGGLCRGRRVEALTGDDAAGHLGVGVTEGHALLYESFGQIGCHRRSVAGCRGHPLRAERDPRDAHAQRRERPLEIVDLVEAGPLVLLEVAVVRERQPFQRRQKSRQPAHRRPRLSPRQLGRV